jgi:hypothetical protein
MIKIQLSKSARPQGLQSVTLKSITLALCAASLMSNHAVAGQANFNQDGIIDTTSVAFSGTAMDACAVAIAPDVTAGKIDELVAHYAVSPAEQLELKGKLRSMFDGVGTIGSLTPLAHMPEGKTTRVFVASSANRENPYQGTSWLASTSKRGFAVLMMGTRREQSKCRLLSLELHFSLPD